MVAPFPDSQANPTHYLTTTSEVTPVYDHRKLSERATQNLQKEERKKILNYNLGQLSITTCQQPSRLLLLSAYIKQSQE